MWYAASLLFQCVRNHSATVDDMWELQIVLIQSDTEANATMLADRTGREKEHEYISSSGDKTCWVFRQVESVLQLRDQEINSGVEVYARYLRAGDVINFMRPFDN